MTNKGCTLEYICIVCPTACHVWVTFDEKGKIKEIAGSKCERGVEFVEKEIENPERILTTTVRTEDPCHPLLPVKTDKPVQTELLLKCMEKIRKVKIKDEVKIHEVIIPNILGTEANLIATDDL